MDEDMALVGNPEERTARKTLAKVRGRSKIGPTE
jgi:hypothetical protein